MTYEYERLTKSKPALLLHENSNIELVCRVIGKDLAHIPHWLHQSEALFKPVTPAAMRVMLFNSTVARHYKGGPGQYATRIDYYHDMKIGPFLVVYMTALGMTMASEANIGSHKELYNPSYPGALEQWHKFKKPLKRALAAVGMNPESLKR